MKKTKTKVKTSAKTKPSAKPPEKKVSKEVTKKSTKGQVVKLGAKKTRTLRFPPLSEYWSKTKQFLNEAIIELKKVTWPSRKETLGATAVVIILVIILSGFLGIVDLSLSRLVKYIMG
jgi:preprotein translocase subunit SecE